MNRTKNKSRAVIPAGKKHMPIPASSSAEFDELVALFNAGQYAELESRARLLLEQNPDSGAAWKALGACLQVQGKDALTALQKATELLPDDAAAHNNLGAALQELGQIDRALASYHHALELKPDYAAAHNNLGNVLKEQGQLDEAEAHYRRALELKPDYADAHANLGSVLKEQGKQAEASYRRALELNPNLVEVHCNLGVALQMQGRHAEAEASFRRALQLKPDYADAHCNLGAFMILQDRLVEAEASYRRALECKPDFKDVYNNLGAVLHLQGRLGEAEASFRRALECKSDYADAHSNLGLCLLTMGRFTEGWPEYEYRWEISNPKRQRPDTRLPQWTGQAPAAQDRLLVFEEQGLGDKLQFARYLPLAAQRFTSGVSIPTHASLLTLFRRSFPQVEILDSVPSNLLGDLPGDQSAWQWQCPLMSLPLAFNTTLETIPSQVPYLIPDPLRVAHWQNKIAALGLPVATRKIGVVWKTGTMMNIATLKSLALQQLAPLLNQPGCAWFSLQKEPDPDKAAWVASGKLIDWADELGDFDETAALAKNMDLIISACTAMVHLAGGLGLPTWLFNRHASEFRWMRDREDSPWYPTLRLFNQKKSGDWDEVVRRMVVALGGTPVAETGAETGAGIGAGIGESPRAEFDQLVVLFNAGQHAELESRARLLLESYPNAGAVWKMLGIALQAQGKDGLSALQQATQYSPEDAEAHNSLGNVLKGRGQLDDAVNNYRRALQIRPDFVVAYNNLGVTLLDQGKLLEAEQSYRRALEFKPDYAEAHNNLGNVLRYKNRFTEAEAHYLRALEIKPNYADAHSNLGVILNNLGQLDRVVASFRRALELKPGYADAHSNLLHAMNYTNSHTDQECLEEARRYGKTVAEKVTARFTEWRCDNQPKRLRVGLVSGDLRNHPVGYFLENLLAQIDPNRVELIAYPTDIKIDKLSARIKPYFAAWKPLLGLDDAAAARMIHADGVHVLLDLAGHTGHNRLPVFAWKPAPVQASWLGYFATTGVSEMDYLLADEVGVPENQRGNFTETVWTLPETRLCFTPPESNLLVAPLPALKNGHITFGCFQNMAKAGDEVLKAWADILNALPDAKLRWQCKQMGDPEVAKQLMQRFQRHNINSARVSLQGPSSREAYLAAYAEVDLLLDTFPFPGGTTTCEALWMGVPTLTLAGTTLLSRQGASLLVAAGLQNWVATSVNEYVDKAITLSGDLNKLASLRAGLREQVKNSPLFDAPHFARNLENALWGMWRARDRQSLNSNQPGNQPGNQPENQQESVMNIPTEISSTAKIFLHVGCGTKRKAQTTRAFNNDAWTELRLDIDANASPDIVGSMTDMPGVKDASVDAVFSSHNIEHLYPHDVPIALKEFLRVLKPDGFLVVTCPDLQSVCALVAEDKLTDAAYSSPAGPIAPLDILYGHRAALAQGNLYMAHHCGFTQRVLTGTLQANGFAAVAAAKRGAPFFDLWAVASKSAMTEDALRQLAVEHFP